MLGEQAEGLSREDIDLTELGRIHDVLDELDPPMVINCAAYTNVDEAEENEELATLVNGEAVGVIARWCANRERPFLTFSTDYVFDGSAREPYVESSLTAPINSYGRSKLVGESLALSNAALVVRTSWLISGTHPNFVATIIRLAREKELSVVDDQIGCPTIASDLARTSYEALGVGARGLLHVTNSGQTSWYGLAREALGFAGQDAMTIRPCSTADYPTTAPRPAYSVLGSERIDGLGVTQPPDWRVSLPAVVSEIMTWV